MLTLTNTPPTPAQTASRLYFHVAQDNHFMIKSLTDHAILYESGTYSSREEATAAAITKYREITPSTDAPTPHKPSASAPKTAATPKTDAEPVQLALIAPLPITEAAGAIKVNAKELYKAIKAVKFSTYHKTTPTYNYMKIELTDAGIVISTPGPEECKTAEPVHFWGNGERWTTCAPMITKAAVYNSRGIDTGRTKNVNPFMDYVKIHADDNETINLTLDPKTQNLTAQVGRSTSIFKCIDAQEWPAATTAAAINPEPTTSAPYKIACRHEATRTARPIQDTTTEAEAALIAESMPHPATDPLPDDAQRTAADEWTAKYPTEAAQREATAAAKQAAATPYIKFNKLENEIARREESINQLEKRLEAAEAAAINPAPTTSAPAAILENEAGAATEEAINPDSEMRRRVAAYAAKRNAKIERITKAAQRTEAEAGARLNTARKMAAVIPFGQPILIGHHSEKRDRNYRGRIDGRELKYTRGAEWSI